MSIIEGFGSMDFCANLLKIVSSHARTGWDSFIRPPNRPPILNIMCRDGYAPLGAIVLSPWQDLAYSYIMMRASCMILDRSIRDSQIESNGSTARGPRTHLTADNSAGPGNGTPTLANCHNAAAGGSSGLHHGAYGTTGEHCGRARHWWHTHHHTAHTFCP